MVADYLLVVYWSISCCSSTLFPLRCYSKTPSTRDTIRTSRLDWGLKCKVSPGSSSTKRGPRVFPTVGRGPSLTRSLPTARCRRWKSCRPIGAWITSTAWWARWTPRRATGTAISPSAPARWAEARPLRYVRFGATGPHLTVSMARKTSVKLKELSIGVLVDHRGEWMSKRIHVRELRGSCGRIFQYARE